MALSCSPGHRSARVGCTLMDRGALFTTTLREAVQPLWLRKVRVSLPARTPVMVLSAVSLAYLGVKLSME